MSRCLVNVGTNQYAKGGARLETEFRRAGEMSIRRWESLPKGWPTHQDVPYAFKAYALKEVERQGYESLLWLDACIVPGARPLRDLWEHIEKHGYWIARNGFVNYTWTADAAYPDLGVTREENRTIPHVVATAFGVSLAHQAGREILAEYYRLAQTRAFCGPWANGGVESCGPDDVRGHRHDQSCLSVIAWRLGCTLSSCPEWFSYRGGEQQTTCLIADGAY